MAKNNIEKYLSRYAEPEVAQLEDLIPKLPQTKFDYACVVPAYKETTTFVDQLLESHLKNKTILLVLVINQPDSEADTELQLALYHHVSQLGTTLSQSEQLKWLSLKNSKSSILLVDRFESPIPNNFGVGLARKIGCDLALELYHRGLVNSKFIGSTDADAQLPADYFDEISKLSMDTSFAVFNFSHISDNNELYLANRRYETALRYYVAGLNYAGSDYGHYTIGSLLAVNLEHYAMARGFPKRSAGEDFYLLNKLAKLGSWKFFEKSTVKLQARTSNRVPFGTGPAVAKILELTDNQQQYYYYHPSLFEKLRTLLSHFTTLNGDNIEEWSAKVEPDILIALNHIGFEKFYRQNKNNAHGQFKKQLTNWFDNFKTLKFLHSLRESNASLKDIPLEISVEMAPFRINDFPVVDD